MNEAQTNPVFRLLSRIPEKDRTVILVRHSDRPSFEGVPYDVRPFVELTRDGIAHARFFGASLAAAAPGRHIHILHTPAVRCHMTAHAIRDGLSPENSARIGIGDAPLIADPVRDLDRFRQLNEQYGWHGMIRLWLDGQVDDDVLWNARWYSDALVRQVLDGPAFRPGEIRVVIAHDITLFPLIHAFFGRSITTIGYLHGIVIKAGPDEMDIGFEGEVRTLSLGNPVSSG